MDRNQFDHLIKWLATTRLTRLQTLRGLAAASIGAVTRITRLSEEAGAKKNHEKKVKVCKCPDSNSANCRTAKVKKSQAKKQARKACNYKGTCQAGVTACAAAAPTASGAQCTNNAGCSGGQVCEGGQCVNCVADQQCSGGLICLTGTCQTPSGPVACQNNTQCTGGQICLGGTCQNCTHWIQCGTDQICLPSGRCGGGEECDPANTNGCSEPLACQEVGSGSNIYRCLIEGFQSFNECPPLDNLLCPTWNGVQSICLLGQCVSPCTEPVGLTCAIVAWGTCENGICFDLIS